MFFAVEQQIADGTQGQCWKHSMFLVHLCTLTHIALQITATVRGRTFWTQFQLHWNGSGNVNNVYVTLLTLPESQYSTSTRVRCSHAICTHMTCSYIYVGTHSKACMNSVGPAWPMTLTDKAIFSKWALW